MTVGSLTEDEQKSVQEIQNELNEFAKNRVPYDADTLSAAVELWKAINRDTQLLALLHAGEITATKVEDEFGFVGLSDNAKDFLGQA